MQSDILTRNLQLVYIYVLGFILILLWVFPQLRDKINPYFFGAWIPTVFMSETLSLFFGVGIDLNSFYFINLIPIFFWGLDLNSFFVQKPYPYLLFGGDGSQQFSFQKPYPYFFLSGFHLNSFHFRNLLPIF